MLIGKKMIDGLNAQLGREYSAAMQYLAMAAWFDGEGLKGLAGFFFKQSAEESEHGLKIVHYLGEVGGTVLIPAIEQPKTDYADVEAALQDFLDMEHAVTRAVYELVELAQAEKDHSANQFLQWYVAEQREEVSSAQELLDTARCYGPERIPMMDAALRRG
jgi:ferritin